MEIKGPSGPAETTLMALRRLPAAMKKVSCRVAHLYESDLAVGTGDLMQLTQDGEAMTDKRYPREKPAKRQSIAHIRLPDGMREELKAAAKANGRTMNSEVIARLEAPQAATFDASAICLVASSRELLEALRECRLDLMEVAAKADHAGKTDNCWEGVGDRLRTQIEQADAAIAKATGESE